MNMVGDDHILVVNSEHRVDVFKRGDSRKVKTLDIEYMRYSLVLHNMLFIGTEEKMLYLIDALTFEAPGSARRALKYCKCGGHANKTKLNEGHHR